MSLLSRRCTRTSVILLTLAAACTKKDSRLAVDSAKAPAQPTAGAPARPRGGPVFPGTLSKAIDSYTGDELYDFTKQLTYAGSHERNRECKNSSGCGGLKPLKTTLVQVSAVATQDSLVESNVPEFGVVYTRAVNKGKEEEARYGMRPGTQFRYYMIVLRDTAGGMRWRLEELDTNVPRRHTQIATGEFIPCGHPWKPGARADFKTCQAAERQDTVVTMGLALQGIASDPMWVGCGSGCCIYGT